MAIRIEARIEPNVTRIEPNLPEFPDYTRIMTRMSIRIGTNMTENATKLPEFATESLDLGQIWTRIIIELRRHHFPGGTRGVQELYSGLFSLYSALYSDGDSDGFWELFGAFWADSLYSCYSGLFGWIIRVVPQLTIRIRPNLPRMSRMPPRIWPNPVKFHQNISRIWLE